MKKKSIQDFLPLVKKPSQYLGTEINAVRKDHHQIELSIALAFPDLYEIGTSHFGLQILYHILNRQKEISAERVFTPDLDMQAYLRAHRLPLLSLESRRPLKTFDWVGFSLLYELNYTNVMAMLDLAGIPLHATERGRGDPLVIAGGPCTCNPEPVAEFFDAMVVGDAETVILQMAQIFMKWKTDPLRCKSDLLKSWSSLAGLYIPSFFKAIYDAQGFQTLQPQNLAYSKAKRAVVADIDAAAFPETPVLPFGRPIHDRLRLEVARGCTRGCRFCQAGMIYRPVRERSIATLLRLSSKAITKTGYEDLSLLSLSSGDYSGIALLLEQLMTRCEHQHIAISFPSLRADTLTPELMRLVQRVRKTGFTIAPEAGSQRLRDVINKDITRQTIIQTVQDAYTHGWQVIKLYFMIGLPGETQEDLDELIDLVKALRKGKRPQGRSGKINVSLATFIPKPHTPFQWASQNSLAESRNKIAYIRDHLKLGGIQVKWQKPEVSILEGLWARGDRRLGRLLAAAYKRGCCFDGWSDHFNYDKWEAAIAEAQVDIDFFTTRRRSLNEPLPWDHIDMLISRDFLVEEWERARRAVLTSDCRKGDCNDCGVCDFRSVEPKVAQAGNVSIQKDQMPAHNLKEEFRRLEIVYAKKGAARYFGHLELINILLRALRRAQIPLQHTRGFHPKPKIAFEDPLPLGIESLQELCYLNAAVDIPCAQLMSAVNAQLPQGLQIIECRAATVKMNGSGWHLSEFQVLLEDALLEIDRLNNFMKHSEFIISQSNRKGHTKKVDLKALVADIKLVGSAQMVLKLYSAPGKTVRPGVVLSHIFGLSEAVVKTARIVRTSFERIPNPDRSEPNCSRTGKHTHGKKACHQHG